MNERRSRNRRVPLALAALLAAAALSAAPAWTGPARATSADGFGVPAARVRGVLQRHPLRMLDGRETSLASLRGEVVVLNFWASWCAPCRKELPRLDALHAEISPRGGRVLAISIDTDRHNVERFAARHALGLPIVHDGPDGLARALDLTAVPLTVVLDPNGEVAFTTRRSDAAGLDEVAATARRLLAGRPVASGSRDLDRP